VVSPRVFRRKISIYVRGDDRSTVTSEGEPQSYICDESPPLERALKVGSARVKHAPCWWKCPASGPGCRLNLQKATITKRYFSSSSVFSVGSANLPRLDGASRSFEAMVSRELSRFNGVIARNGGRSLVGWILRNLSGVSGRVSASRVKLSCVFAFHVAKIWASEGPVGVVQHLKTSHVLIQQAVGGYKVRDLSSLGRRVRRARSGLPYWIPVQARRSLMAGSVSEIRFWTSCCAIYRVIEFPGRLKLGTITDPSPVKWAFAQDSPWAVGLATVLQFFWSK